MEVEEGQARELGCVCGGGTPISCAGGHAPRSPCPPLSSFPPCTRTLQGAQTERLGGLRPPLAPRTLLSLRHPFFSWTLSRWSCGALPKVVHLAASDLSLSPWGDRAGVLELTDSSTRAPSPPPTTPSPCLFLLPSSVLVCHLFLVIYSSSLIPSSWPSIFCLATGTPASHPHRHWPWGPVSNAGSMSLAHLRP